MPTSAPPTLPVSEPLDVESSAGVRRGPSPKMEALMRAVHASDRFTVGRVCTAVREASDTALERHLLALSQETGIEVPVLRTLAAISDERNSHLFTAEAARKAFAGVKLRD